LHPSTDEIVFSELPSWKYRRGESRYYVLKSLRSVLAVRKFDVALFGGWESPASWALLFSSILFRVARVGFYESPENTMTYRSGVVAWMRSRFFRSMDMVVVPGQAAAEAVVNMGVQPSRILQGFNAVDVSEFHKAAVSGAHDDLVTSAGHRYLYVGRLIDLKRVDAIIEAFIQIGAPDDELTIVGAGSLRENLRLLADRSELKITFLEHTENSEMPGVMALHHTLVLASEREVWGLVVNEALASGMHVVVTDNCGVVPSVRKMPGVYVAEKSLSNLACQMQISRAMWTGRIAEPEILQHTPQRFAKVFDSAFVASLGDRRRSILENLGKETLRSWRRSDS
jgi:glycosyltransferase involved in cell wall biosynthesis